MSRPRVYVETTIPSFFHTLRSTPDNVARRDWTRLWWSIAVERYDLMISGVVLEELSGGRPDRGAVRISLVQDLTVLPVTEPVLEIAQAYVRHKLMPASLGGDALHLALASYYKCDFLVTWNCRHLANANKFGHIRRVNGLLGLTSPMLVTPLELLGEDDESASP